MLGDQLTELKMSKELWEQYQGMVPRDQRGVERELEYIQSMGLKGAISTFGLGFELTREQFMEYTGDYDELRDVAAAVVGELNANT